MNGVIETVKAAVAAVGEKMVVEICREMRQTVGWWLSGEGRPSSVEVAVLRRMLRHIDPQAEMKLSPVEEVPDEELRRADVALCNWALARANVKSCDLGGGDYFVREEEYSRAEQAMAAYGDGRISAAEMAEAVKPLEEKYLAIQLRGPSKYFRHELLRAVLCASRGQLTDCALALVGGQSSSDALPEIYRVTEPLMRAAGCQFKWQPGEKIA